VYDAERWVLYDEAMMGVGRLVFVEKMEEDEAETVSNAVGGLDLGNAGQTCRIKTLLGELERESVGKRREMGGPSTKFDIKE
jgi:hypothetical protein